VQNAEWNFSIDQPSLERFNSWQTKPDENWRLFVDNESITPTRTFLYAYIGRTPGGFAVTTPEILGLRVSSDPENFIAGQTQRQSGSFRVVEIKVNQDFLDQMQVGAEQQVKIKISFRTQFGEPVNDEFHAVIIR
jgi:hypothetical protein